MLAKKACGLTTLQPYWPFHLNVGFFNHKIIMMIIITAVLFILTILSVDYLPFLLPMKQTHRLDFVNLNQIKGA